MQPTDDACDQAAIKRTLQRIYRKRQAKGKLFTPSADGAPKDFAWTFALEEEYKEEKAVLREWCRSELLYRAQELAARTAEALSGPGPGRAGASSCSLRLLRGRLEPLLSGSSSSGQWAMSCSLTPGKACYDSGPPEMGKIIKIWTMYNLAVLRLVGKPKSHEPFGSQQELREALAIRAGRQCYFCCQGRSYPLRRPRVRFLPFWLYSHQWDVSASVAGKRGSAKPEHRLLFSCKKRRTRDRTIRANNHSLLNDFIGEVEFFLSFLVNCMRLGLVSGSTTIKLSPILSTYQIAQGEAKVIYIRISLGKGGRAVINVIDMDELEQLSDLQFGSILKSSVATGSFDPAVEAFALQQLGGVPSNSDPWSRASQFLLHPNPEVSTCLVTDPLALDS